jgi:hypothetical protein
MSGLHRVDAGQLTNAAADALLSKKSLLFAHPDEVVDDQELPLANKRSLLGLMGIGCAGGQGFPFVAPVREWRCGSRRRHHECTQISRSS